MRDRGRGVAEAWREAAGCERVPEEETNCDGGEVATPMVHANGNSAGIGMRDKREW